MFSQNRTTTRYLKRFDLLEKVKFDTYKLVCLGFFDRLVGFF